MPTQDLNIVFILGAGASAQAGCPVMSDFFECASTLFRHGRLGEFEVDYQVVERVRQSLFHAKLKSNLDVDHLEKVFNAIEMGDFLRRPWPLPDPPPDRDARTALVRLIAGVLERTLEFSPSNAPDQHIDGLSSARCIGGPGPTGYDELARFCHALMAGSPTYHPSVITFNYDVGLEYGLSGRKISYRYAELEENQIPRTVPVFKLHGSANWLRTPNQVGPTIVPLLDFDRTTTQTGIWPTRMESKDRRYMLVSEWLRRAADSRGIPAVPFIVPPSESKHQDRQALRPVWSGAAEAISQADYIVVVGYSIPDTDEFFRQFFAIASISERRIMRFCLVDPNPPVQGKYRELVGPVLGDRFVYIPHDMKGGMSDLARRYRVGRGLL